MAAAQPSLRRRILWAPPIAPADSETGRWIDAHGFGFTLPEPLEATLPALVEDLDRARIGEARKRLLAAPDSVFLQPKDELKGVLAAAAERAA